MIKKLLSIFLLKVSETGFISVRPYMQVQKVMQWNFIFVSTCPSAQGVKLLKGETSTSQGDPPRLVKRVSLETLKLFINHGVHSFTSLYFTIVSPINKKEM